jgi:hypothetical protein
MEDGGKIWFAWRPVKCINGRWAWLRFVYRKSSPYPLRTDHEQLRI